MRIRSPAIIQENFGIDYYFLLLFHDGRKEDCAELGALRFILRITKIIHEQLCPDPSKEIELNIKAFGGGIGLNSSASGGGTI
jgi:hypothetical protein